MKLHCNFQTCEFTPNGTFILKVKESFDFDNYVFKLSSFEYDSFNDIVDSVNLWLNFVGLKMWRSEYSLFIRHLTHLYYCSSF